MYAIVKAFLDRLGTEPHSQIRFTESESRIAMAVLLFRVVTIDGQIKDEELDLYRSLLRERLGVSAEELAIFEAEVKRVSSREPSLFPFTAIIRRMPMRTKREIVKMMKDISISDNELHEFEINLVARTAELLDIPIE
jgi:uncharacterized tellurite resistance protein B-like protein